jgi:hypothetical protein
MEADVPSPGDSAWGESNLSLGKTRVPVVVMTFFGIWRPKRWLLPWQLLIGTVVHMFLVWSIVGLVATHFIKELFHIYPFSFPNSPDVFFTVFVFNVFPPFCFSWALSYFARRMSPPPLSQLGDYSPEKVSHIDRSWGTVTHSQRKFFRRRVTRLLLFSQGIVFAAACANVLRDWKDPAYTILYFAWQLTTWESVVLTHFVFWTVCQATDLLLIELLQIIDSGDRAFVEFNTTRRVMWLLTHVIDELQVVSKEFRPLIIVSFIALCVGLVNISFVVLITPERAYLFTTELSWTLAAATLFFVCLLVSIWFASSLTEKWKDVQEAILTRRNEVLLQHTLISVDGGDAMASASAPPRFVPHWNALHEMTKRGSGFALARDFYLSRSFTLKLAYLIVVAGNVLLKLMLLK